MKEILLKLENSLLFLEKINEDVSLIKYKDKYTIDITEENTKINYDETQNNLKYALYNVLSLYLLENEVIREIEKSKNGTNKDLEEMLKIVLGELYYPVISNLELERFFYSNNKLVEIAFIDFNLTGLKEELKVIYEKIKKDEKDEKELNKVKVQLLKNGIDIKDYKELILSYNEEEMITLSNEKGEQITPDNILEKYRIKLNTDYYDDLAYDILFCGTICLLLGVKVLYIEKVYSEIYFNLSENEMLKRHGLKLVLY